MRDTPRILVAEDNPDNLLLLEDRLLFHGYEVITAVDGQQALRLGIEQRPDLILLDGMMPHLDGVEVCRRLRADSSLPFIPIIMVTARAESSDVVAGLEAGADEYLTKPVDPEALLARVRSMLRIKALHDQLEDVNRTLERRVQEQVAELDRAGQLRRYLSPQVANLILSSGGELLKPHRGEIVAVFGDLRGYTPFTETAPAEDVIHAIQEYHQQLGPLVQQYDGTIERFIGDGLMVFFNDPIPCPNPAERAVRMAVAMRACMATLTRRWQDDLDYTVGFGIGIDQGHATMGRIGFEGRFDYAATGPAVNRAARLCAEARDQQILITQRVYAATQDVVDVEYLDRRDLKGFRDPVRVYNVVGLK